MSSSKLDTSGVFESSSGSSETHLSLPADAVQFHKNGIVFPCGRAIPVWREMTVDLHSPRNGKHLSCTGVVVACQGVPPDGYQVSMVFLNLSPRSARTLSAMAYT
jgi:hypothetical protein